MTLIYEYASPSGCAHKYLKVGRVDGRPVISCVVCLGVWVGKPDVPEEKNP